MEWGIIKNKKEYKKASNRLEKIFDSKKDDSTFDEAELIILLMEKYESKTEEAFPEPDPIELLKYKMKQKNLRSKDLAEIIGGKSKASEILNKKRKLTLSMIRKINKLLEIPAESLIQEYELAN